ncbi:hypothetical protein F5Y05DRAFT_376968 [Hypoxylon sp. FL0543]|nr:hypothetical protein F5Y05DRAFT_376968 [Hypoxylon sp. FL0543]
MSARVRVCVFWSFYFFHLIALVLSPGETFGTSTSYVRRRGITSSDRTPKDTSSSVLAAQNGQSIPILAARKRIRDGKDKKTGDLLLLLLFYYTRDYLGTLYMDAS